MDHGTTTRHVGAPTEPFDHAELPWQYGEDRITAMARDPESIYVFWEISDLAIADARRRLGGAGEWAWCNLRVYDTTGRNFDGTNANDYFDIGVGREDRDRFVMLHRPAASFHFEIGMKSHEGYFQPIARSGAAHCPRNSSSPNHTLEWMTVTTGTGHPTARPYVSRYAGPPPGSHAPRHAPELGVGPAPSHGASSTSYTHEHHTTESRSWTWSHPSAMDVRWEGPWLFGEWHAEWRLHWLDAGMRTSFSVGPIETTSWSMGPFPIALLPGDRIEMRFIGDVPAVLRERQSGLAIWGPWQITIKSFDAEPQRRVLGTWQVHWVTVSPPQVERWWTAIERRRLSAFRREVLTGGASGAHAFAEAGASEMWRIGGSERQWIGASEWLALGGTEVLWLGASQLVLGGASAFLAGGASEVRWLGGSEVRWAGGSEVRWAGASEVHWLGGSEVWQSWLGASEIAALGASEHAWVGASDTWADAFGASEITALGASEQAASKGRG